MPTNLLRACAVAAILSTAGVAHAKPGDTYGDATAPLIVTLLHSLGLPGRIAYTRSGEPTVRSRVGKDTVSVYLFACDEQAKPVRCKGIQFHAGYTLARPLPLARMNEWNRTKRYARGYLERDWKGKYTKARVEMDLSFSGGMTRGVFVAHFDLFRRLTRAFRRHIGYN